MKAWPSVRRTCLFAFTLVLACLPLQGADLIWTNTAGGNGLTPANWSPNQVPGATDNLWITNSGAYSVRLSGNIVIQSMTLGTPIPTDSVQIEIPSGSLTVSNLTANVSGRILISGGTLISSGANQIAGTVNQSGGSWRLGSLGSVNVYNLTNGELRGRTLIATNFYWTAGALNADAPGDSLIIPNGGSGIIAGASTKTLSDYTASNNGRSITNLGTLTLSDYGLLGYYGPRIHNAGTFTAANATGIASAGAGLSPFFINTGTFSAVTNFHFNGDYVINFGSLLAQSGTLTFTGCAFTNHPNSQLSLSASATCDFTGAGLNELNGQILSPGFNRLRFLAGNTYLATTNLQTPSLYLLGGVLHQRTNHVVSQVNQSAGTWNLLVACTASTYNLTNGELRGRTLIATNFYWTAGALNADAPGDSLIIPNGGSGIIAGASTKTLSDYTASNNGRSITNLGTLTLSDYGLLGYYGPRIHNAGTFTATNATGIASAGAGLSPFFINTGTFSATTNFHFNGDYVINFGSLLTQSGTLTFTGCAFTNQPNSQLSLSASATCDFTGAGLNELNGQIVSPGFNRLRFLAGNSYLGTTNLQAPSIYLLGGTLHQRTNHVVSQINQSAGTWNLLVPCTASTYNLTNGELRGRTLIATNFFWSAGALNADAPGDSLIIPNGGSAVINGPSTKALGDYTAANNGRSITNLGSLTLSDYGILGYYGPRIHNAGTFSALNTTTIASAGAGLSPFFINTGTFSANTNFHFNGDYVINFGSLLAQSGTLTFTGCAFTNQPNSQLSLSASATCDLTGAGLNELNGQILSPGYNRLRFLAGNSYLATTNLQTPSLYLLGGVLHQRTNHVVSQVNQSAGTWNLLVPCTASTYNLTNGELRGRTLIATNFFWSAGALNADTPGDSLIIPNGGNAVINGPSTKALGDYTAANNGRSITNLGSLTLSDYGILGYYGPRIHNAGTFTALNSTAIASAGAGLSPFFINTGTFSAVTNFHFNNDYVINFGSLLAQSGTLTFTSCAFTNQSSSQLSLSASANCDFTGSGLNELNGQILSPGFNRLRFIAGNSYLGTTNLQAPSIYLLGGTLHQRTNHVVSQLNQSAGTWNLLVPCTASTYNLTNGELRGRTLIATNFYWSAGALNADAPGDSLIIPNSGSAVINGPSTKALGDYTAANNGRSITNLGSLTLSDYGILGYYGPRIHNAGTFTALTPTAIASAGAGFNPAFFNNGSFVAQTNVTFTSVAVTNRGTITMKSGNARLTSLTQLSGSTSLGTNFLVDGNVLIAAGSFTGGGKVLGQLINQGTLNPGQPLGRIESAGFTNSSLLSVQIAGTTPATTHDQMRCTTAVLSGNLEVHLTNGFVPTPGDLYTAVVAQARSGVFQQLISPDYGFTLIYTPTTVVLRADNALPRISFLSPDGDNPSNRVCTPLLVSVAATDIGGYITNMTIQSSYEGEPFNTLGRFSNTNVLASTLTRSVRLLHDFPGLVTLRVETQDDRGGLSVAEKIVRYGMDPIRTLTIGGIRPGGFAFCMQGDPGRSYSVEASTNLIDWLDIGPMVFIHGIHMFTDPEQPRIPHRFYRSREE